MKVILLRSVPKVGKKDDIVEVNQGYAANALFPKGLAIPATDAAVGALKVKEQNKVVQKQIQHDLLDRAIGALGGTALVVAARANEKGILFSKVVAADISAALLSQHRISIDPALLTPSVVPIKHVGTYTVRVAEGTYETTFALMVVAA